MANYNLGSVQGEVKITYDGKGIKQAKEDVGTYRDELGRLRNEHGRFIKDTDKAGESVLKLGRDLRDVESAVKGVAGALRSAALPTLLMAGAHAGGVLVAAVSPAVGAIALLPGVLGVAAASMAVVQTATSGMGDALSAAAEGDAKKLEEAMAKLSPAAQQFVRDYQAIKPALDQVRIDTQEALFRELGGTMQLLGNAYLPTVRTGFAGIATQMGSVGKQSAAILATETAVGHLQTILKSTESVFRELGQAPGDLVAGLVAMGAAASTHLVPMATQVAGLALRFREWAQSAEGQAQINEWIRQGVAVLSQLWQILTNIGRIAVNIFRPLAADGASFLETMIRLTDQAAAWTASAEGQQTIANIWSFLGAVAGNLITIIGILAGILGTVANFFGMLPAPVQQVVAGFLAWSTIIGLVLARVAPLVGFLIQMGPLILKLGPALMSLVTGFTAVMNVFRALSLLFLTNPWLLLIAAVIALVAIIIMNWDTIWAYLQTIWNTIVTVAGTVWNGLVSFFSGIWEQIKAPVQAAWLIIQTIIQTAWDIILNILRFGAAILLALFFTMWNPLVDAVTAAWNAVVAFLSPIIETIRAAIEVGWNAISAITSSVWNAIVAVLTQAWNAIWGVIEPYVNLVMNLINSAWNTVSGTTSSVWATITGVISGAWNTIRGIFQAGVGIVMGILGGLWNQISGLAGTALNLLVQAGRNIVQGLWNGIQAMGSWLYNSIMGWVRSVVPGPILSFLGIASPSKWMRDEVGKMIPQGIVVGMEAEEKGLIAQARHLADAAAQAATGGNVGTLAMAANRGTTSAPLSTGLISPAVAGATSNTRTVNIGSVTIPVTGNLDPTNPVQWRQALESLRDGLTTVEASYR